MGLQRVGHEWVSLFFKLENWVAKISSTSLKNTRVSVPQWLEPRDGCSFGWSWHSPPLPPMPLPPSVSYHELWPVLRCNSWTASLTHLLTCLASIRIWGQLLTGVNTKPIVMRALPGHPVVATLCFHCRGHRFDPWSGKKDPTRHMAK